MKRLPAIWRKRNGAGRYTGNCYIRLDGKDVNLGTSDQNEAARRRLEAVRSGRRNFVDEIDEAAAATETGGEAEGPTGAHTPGIPGATPGPATSPTASTAAAATAPTASTPPVRPDAVIPPAPAPQVPLQLPPVADDARAEAQATNEAAAEGDAGDDQADAGAGAVPPEVLDGFLEQGAHVIVDLQLELQAALIRKRTKKQPARIPDDSPVRAMAAAAWVAQLKIWIPPDKMLPPWALAIVLPAMCFPQQYATAVPIKDEKQPDGQAASGPDPVAAAA